MNPQVGHRAQVASHIPGRLRVKLHPQSRQLHVMNRIKENLEAQEGIHQVQVNQITGSITMQYDHRLHGDMGIFGLLKDVDVIVETLMHAPAIEQPRLSSEAGGVLPTFIEAIDDLNNRVFRLTGIRIDLKLLLPLAFFGAGVWSISKSGLMIEKVPGWLFLWLAFDMFVKLYPNRSAP